MYMFYLPLNNVYLTSSPGTLDWYSVLCLQDRHTYPTVYLTYVIVIKPIPVIDWVVMTTYLGADWQVDLGLWRLPTVWSIDDTVIRHLARFKFSHGRTSPCKKSPQVQFCQQKRPHGISTGANSWGILLVFNI